MIVLSLLWKFTKFVFKLASKILGFLIVKLYLWIPLGFAAIFAICSAAVPFSFLKYMPHFIVIVSSGLVLSMLLFVRKLLGLKRAKKPEPEPDILPKKEKARFGFFKKKRAIDNNPEPIQYNQNQNYPPQAWNYQEQYVGPEDIKRSLLQKRNAEWFNATYEVVPEVKPAPNIPDLKAYSNSNYYSNNYDVAFESPAKLYRTRKDPSLFIAEYPDRLEYYRKTSNGFVLVSVEENSLRLQNKY
ncbi:MAG TPA: hypothetical protein VIL24_03530 [Clostridia bacterium]